MKGMGAHAAGRRGTDLQDKVDGEEGPNTSIVLQWDTGVFNKGTLKVQQGHQIICFI